MTDPAGTGGDRAAKGGLERALGRAAELGRASERRLVRELARHYDRSRDLPVALVGRCRDYELEDRCCRWITAGLMHRLCRVYRDQRARRWPHRSRPYLVLLRKCLRGEAAIYRRQTAEKAALGYRRAEAGDGGDGRRDHAA